MSATYRLVRPTRPATAAPRLDDAQRRVVEHTGGPLLVLAGPGTGKTTTLVETAVARVEAGVPIEQLLMLTFGRRAAGELRDRVTARLGGTVREPVARTFHSYAFGVLRMAAVAAQLPAPRLLSAPEQDVILRELVGGDLSRWPAALRPALGTRAFAGELRDLLLRAVERGLDGPRLTALGRARRRDDWVAAGGFLQEYLDVTSLARPGAWDPAELIRTATDTLLTDPDLLGRERALRRHILVDEYQDTDPAQAELLALLANGADELIIVGDPDQSIYAFRGAEPSATSDRFGELPVVALGTSRRAGSALLAATRRVAIRLPGRGEHRALSAAHGAPPGRVEVALLRSAAEEASYVAARLRGAHLDDELPWSRMAVLVRSTTTTLAVLRRALVAAGVPVAVPGSDVPLAEQPAVAHLLTALRCVLRADELTEDLAEHLLLGPIGRADALQLRRLRRELRATGEGQLAPVLLDEPGAAVLPERVRRPVQRVASALAAGRRARSAGASAEDVLWAVWHATGLAYTWEAASLAGGPAGAAADRDLDSVIELFEAAARFTDRQPGAPPERFFEHLEAQQIPGESRVPSPMRSEAVQVLTAHASKGLEWDLVVVAHVQEAVWPDLRRRGTLLGSELLVDITAGRDGAGVSTLAPQIAEERRLFYVAATRARRRLVVTAVGGDDEQPSRFLDELDPIEGERSYATVPRGVHLPDLVAALRAAVCDPAEPGPERQAAAAELARLAHAGVTGAHPNEWWGLAPLSDDGPVGDPDRPVTVSPSRIESYLRCELRALLTQLGARDGDQVGASLGTLIHEVAAVSAPDADLPALERLVDERWHALDFGASWLATHERERARTMLAKLIQWLRASRTSLSLVDVERDFDVVVGDARLRGRVDRLERDAAGRSVVIDLKTGRSKADDPSANAQLGAYQLAVEAGAFGPATAGGARLVQIGTPHKSVVEQMQAPLAEAEDPGWIADLVDQVAQRLRGSVFTATANSYCGACDVKSSCPLMYEGRQVTG